MTNLISYGWDLVNNAETRKDIIEAEAWIRTNIKDNDLFDDLMSSLAFKSRELYRA